MARAKHPSLRLHGLKKKKSLKKYFLNLKERKYEKKIILNLTMARKNSFQIPKKINKEIEYQLNQLHKTNFDLREKGDVSRKFQIFVGNLNFSHPCRA